MSSLIQLCGSALGASGLLMGFSGVIYLTPLSQVSLFLLQSEAPKHFQNAFPHLLPTFALYSTSPFLSHFP